MKPHVEYYEGPGYVGCEVGYAGFVARSVVPFDHQQVGGLFSKVKKLAKKVAKSKAFKAIAKTAWSVAKMTPYGAAADAAFKIAKGALGKAKRATREATSELRGLTSPAAASAARFSARYVPSADQAAMPAAAPATRISPQFRERLIRELLGAR